LGPSYKPNANHVLEVNERAAIGWEEAELSAILRAHWEHFNVLIDSDYFEITVLDCIPTE